MAEEQDRIVLALEDINAFKRVLELLVKTRSMFRVKLWVQSHIMIAYSRGFKGSKRSTSRRK
jgi:hypothetical protein